MNQSENIFKEDLEFVKDGKIYKVKDIIKGMELLFYHLRENWAYWLYYYFYDKENNKFYELYFKGKFKGINFNWKTFKFNIKFCKIFDSFAEIDIKEIIPIVFENNKNLAKELSRRFIK